MQGQHDVLPDRQCVQEIVLLKDESQPKEKILEIENVTKYYGSGAVVTKALDGISFDVEN